MDAGKKSYDKPPVDHGERRLVADASDSDLVLPEPPVRLPPDPTPLVDPTPDYAPRAPLREVERTSARKITVAAMSEVTDIQPDSALPSPAGDESLTSMSSDRPQSSAGNHKVEPMNRGLKIAYTVVLGILAVSLLGLAYVHLLHHPDNRHAPQVASPTTTTSVAVTTTSAALPTSLRPTAEAAAAALVSSWSTNNRLGALAVATPTAASTLFSVPYASGLAIERGCSTSFSPIVCTYGPPGGASPTDRIYQLMVSQASGGWYVSSVKVEN